MATIEIDCTVYLWFCYHLVLADIYVTWHLRTISTLALTKCLLLPMAALLKKRNEERSQGWEGRERKMFEAYVI